MFAADFRSQVARPACLMSCVSTVGFLCMLCCFGSGSRNLLEHIVSRSCQYDLQFELQHTCSAFDRPTVRHCLCTRVCCLPCAAAVPGGRLSWYVAASVAGTVVLAIWLDL
jgi:hypothetical protein